MNVLQPSDVFRFDMSLSNKDITEIEAYIDGYGLSISKKRFVFRRMGENERIEFYKKGNKLIRTLYNGKNTVVYYCKKTIMGLGLLTITVKSNENIYIVVSARMKRDNNYV